MLDIQLQPNQLLRGNNQVMLLVKNKADVACDDLIVYLSPSENLFVPRISRIRFPLLNPGDSAKSTIEMNTSRTGLAIIELRYSGKWLGRLYRDTVIFELKVIDDTGQGQKRPSSSGYTSTYKRDYYINSLPDWKDLLALQRSNLQKLKKKQAIYAPGEEPLSLLNQIELTEQEISTLRQKIEEAETYLADFS